MIYILLFFILTMIFSFISINSIAVMIEMQDYLIETTTSFLVLSFLILVMVIYILFEIFLIPKKSSLEKSYLNKLFITCFNMNIFHQIGFIDKYQYSAKYISNTLDRNSMLVKLFKIKKQLLTNEKNLTEDDLIEIMENKNTKFLGSYYLINFLKKRGNYLLLKDVLNKIENDDPNYHTYLLPIKLDILIRENSWLKAAECLHNIIDNGVKIDFDTKRKLAVIYYIIADEFFKNDNDIDKAIIYLNKSISVKNGILGVVLKLSDLLKLKSKQKEALSLLNKYYKVSPHRDIVRKYFGISGYNVENFLYTVEELLNINGDNRYIYDVAAEISIDFEMFSHSKDFIDKSFEFGENFTNLMIITRLFIILGEKDNANLYITKLSNINISDYWICKSCYKKHIEWNYKCDNCDSFDSLYWYE